MGIFDHIRKPQSREEIIALLEEMAARQAGKELLPDALSKALSLIREGEGAAAVERFLRETQR